MMNGDDNEWMSPAGASSVLRRSERQIRNYAAQKRIRTRRRGPGGRVEYYAADVYALASELQVERDPPQALTAEIVPSTQLAAQVERLHQALRDAEARAERAETALRLLPPPGEAQQWRAELVEAKAIAEGLRSQLAQSQGAGAMAWRLALVALLIALLAVAAVVALALLR
jgi:hypothetical protein